MRSRFLLMFCLKEFVLRSLRASPLTELFFAPCGLHVVKNVCWNVFVGLKFVLISRTESLALVYGYV